MIRFYQPPFIIRRHYPSLTWSKTSENSIYLTFDDGPDPEVTPWVLGELNKIGAKATFFCVGKNLNDHPGIGKKLIETGHLLGNHTFNHLKGTKTSLDDYLEDVKRCDEALKHVNGYNRLFRPPYGRMTKKQIRQLDNKEIIMWSHLSWDFDDSVNSEKVIQKFKKAKPGSILVFHDNKKAFRNLKVILPELLKYYTSVGYKFETLSND